VIGAVLSLSMKVRLSSALREGEKQPSCKSLKHFAAIDANSRFWHSLRVDSRLRLQRKALPPPKQQRCRSRLDQHQACGQCPPERCLEMPPRAASIANGEQALS
jgi:hypothetical protein